MKRTNLGRLPLEQFCNDIPAIFKRTVDRLSKTCAITRYAMRCSHREYPQPEVIDRDCRQADAFISFDRIRAEKWENKFNAYLGKESPVKPSQIDLSLELRDWGGLFINDFNDSTEIKASLRVTPRTIYTEDKDVNERLAKLIDDTIKYNNKQYKKFCDILKTFPFEKTFSYAREALKNAKIPEEKEIALKPSNFGKNSKDGELMKALKVKSRYDDILEARLPYLWGVMFYDLKFATTPSAVVIFYGAGWSKRSFRVYCRYMLDKEGFEKNNPDLERNDIPYLIGKPRIHNRLSDNTAYVSIDGGDFGDFENITTLFLETSVLELSDKEFIEYLKRKRDELLKNLDKIEKEVKDFCSPNKEFRKYASLSHKLNNAYLEDLKKKAPYNKYFVKDKTVKTNKARKDSSRGKAKAN
jgi:hypothetical protein